VQERDGGGASFRVFLPNGPGDAAGDHRTGIAATEGRAEAG
jgi:hypothetical protein